MPVNPASSDGIVYAANISEIAGLATILFEIYGSLTVHSH